MESIMQYTRELGLEIFLHIICIWIGMWTPMVRRQFQVLILRDTDKKWTNVSDIKKSLQKLGLVKEVKSLFRGFQTKPLLPLFVVSVFSWYLHLGWHLHSDHWQAFIVHPWVHLFQLISKFFVLFKCRYQIQFRGT